MPIFLMILLAGLSTLLSAQSITVRDAQTEQPLEGVSIAQELHPQLMLTNREGKADLSIFAKDQPLFVHFMGYRTEVVSWETLDSMGFLLSLSPEGISLHELVVSAQRWQQDRRDVPQRVVAIRTADRLLQQPQTAADLLGSSGEVFVQKSQQGGGSPMIRGFSANRLLISVDGIRMNTAIFRSGNLQNVLSIDPFSLEQAELLLGAGSVLYGSDALGGVMRFETLRPLFSDTNKPLLRGHFTARYGSANQEKTGHFDLRIGTRRFASVTSFSYNDFGDLRMGRYGNDDYLRPFYTQRIDTLDVVISNKNPLLQRPSGFSQTHLLQKFQYNLPHQWSLQYALHFSTTSNFSRYDRLIRTRNGLPRSAEWHYGPQTWLLQQIALQHSAATPLYQQFSLRLSHQFFAESRIDRDWNDDERRHRLEKLQAWAANLDLSALPHRHHRLFYGLEAVYNRVRSSGVNEDIRTGVIQAGPARYPQAHWASYAAYLHYQWKPNPQHQLQAGLRYSLVQLDAVFDTTFYPFPFTQARLLKGAPTASLGWNYHPKPRWTLSAQLASGFRAPNVDDLGKVFDSEPGFVVVPNPDLRPEYVLNGELQLAHQPSDWLRWEVSGYYTRLFQAMVRRDFRFNGQDSLFYDGEWSQVQAVQNAAQAQVWGFLARVDVQTPWGLGFYSIFNYQKGWEELDDESIRPLRHAAPWFGSTHLTYTHRRLRLDLYAQYSGKMRFEQLPPEEQAKAYLYAHDANGNPYCPAWYTLNIKVFCSINELLSISTGIENITDRRYRPYSSGITAAGLHFFAALSLQF